VVVTARNVTWGFVTYAVRKVTVTLTVMGVKKWILITVKKYQDMLGFVRCVSMVFFQMGSVIHVQILGVRFALRRGGFVLGVLLGGICSITSVMSVIWLMVVMRVGMMIVRVMWGIIWMRRRIVRLVLR